MRKSRSFYQNLWEFNKTIWKSYAFFQYGGKNFKFVQEETIIVS